MNKIYTKLGNNIYIYIYIIYIYIYMYIHVYIYIKGQSKIQHSITYLNYKQNFPKN